MKLPTPRWWYVREGRPGPVLHLLLKPLSWAWAAATARRLARGRPVDPGVPVVCVGNITLGGTGKTPVVAALARRLDEAGRRPAILSRGYGGSLLGPVRVDPARHGAGEVGDEPLMLAAALPGVGVWVSRDRVAGALAAARDGAGVILRQLYGLLVDRDATLVEVNPLVQLTDGSLVALDAKVTVDDNALFRQTAVEALRSTFPIDPVEARAKEKGLQYVKLDGEVGIIGNGAGLVMSTLDVVAQAGSRAANFLDVGGGASADQMATSLEVVLSDPAVKTVFVNIFGGITRCDLVAQGVLGALDRVEARVPIVVRLDGTNATEGRKILADAAHPMIRPAATMLEAARLAADLAKGAA